MEEKNTAREHLEARIKALPSQVIEQIGKIDVAKGQWIAGAKLGPQILSRLKKSVLVTSTGASTRIEGAKLSDDDVEKLMKGVSLRRFKDRDQQEVRGYYELLTNIFSAWKKLPLSESLIKHLHKGLLKYTDKDRGHLGEYKKTENRVEMREASGKVIAVLFEPTPAYLTPKSMHELVDWTNLALQSGEHHPLLVIANFVVEFMKIHPFLDGNGRLSRVLTNLLLLRAGYAYVPYVSHEKIIEDNKTEYYLALRQSQQTFDTKKESVIPWLNFFLKVMLKQARLAMDLLSQASVEKLLSERQLAIWQYLQKTRQASPGEIARATRITRSTVNQALDRLLRLKRIERIGLGRSTRYRIIAS